MHLYVHVPFCARRCAYCDFAIAVRRVVPVDDFVDGITRELEIRALGGSGGDSLATLYLGGGTPSKLGPGGIARVLDAVRARFGVARDAEVTIEANPEDVTEDAARAWASAGVNRLSLGAQSFDARVLSWMHRTHSAADTARAVDAARSAGIEGLSLDLIFALPDALERDWDRDLRAAIALAPDHVSAYGLTVEPLTPLGRWTARGTEHEAPEERWSDEFHRAHELLGEAGYAHYEVSNYAREEKRARHNEAYWLDRAYIGVGPSAHGFDGANRRWNEPAYAAWHARVTKGEDPIGGSETLSDEQRASERIYLGLRTDRGLLMDERDGSIVDQWTRAGWATVTERHDSRTIHLTPAGWARLDALATALTFFRSRY